MLERFKKISCILGFHTLVYHDNDEHDYDYDDYKALNTSRAEDKKIFSTSYQ